MEIVGILYVFPDFHTARLGQKIRCSAEDDLFRGSLEIERLKQQLEAQKETIRTQVQLAIQEKELEITTLKGEVEQAKIQRTISETALREAHKNELALKDDQINQLRDFRMKMSTKAIGESLEQHCMVEFNKLRMTAFPRAYFEKDNDARTGSKGDFIFRESSAEGVEFISIMFEMKNEMDILPKTYGANLKNFCFHVGCICPRQQV